MFVSNGILFNHESEVRGSEFVTGGYPVRRQGYTMAQRNQLYGGEYLRGEGLGIYPGLCGRDVDDVPAELPG